QPRHLLSFPPRRSSDLMVISLVLAIVVIGLGVGLMGLLSAVTADEEFARASGLPVRTVNVLIAVMAALTVTLSMRIVGALMVSADRKSTRLNSSHVKIS